MFNSRRARRMLHKITDMDLNPDMKMDSMTALKIVAAGAMVYLGTKMIMEELMD